MATCTYVCAETAREPKDHGGNHHGGGKHRSPVLAGLLLLIGCCLCVSVQVCFIRDFGLTLLREPKFPPYTLRTVYRLSLVMGRYYARIT